MENDRKSPMKCVDHWPIGPMRIMVFEVNPGVGYPDFSVDVTNDGQRYLTPCPPGEGWEPSPRAESEFVLFLISPYGEILFEGLYSRDESHLLAEGERYLRNFQAAATAFPVADRSEGEGAAANGQDGGRRA